MTAVVHALPTAGVLQTDALDLDADERLWVPETSDVTFRPLVLSTTDDYYVAILRIRRGGTVARHRTTGAVHTATLRGRWSCPETGWQARPGSFCTTPPGVIHSCVVPDDVVEMAAMVTVRGTCTYLDRVGAPHGSESVLSKLERARAHYAAVGVGTDYLEGLVC